MEQRVYCHPTVYIFLLNCVINNSVDAVSPWLGGRGLRRQLLQLRRIVRIIFTCIGCIITIYVIYLVLDCPRRRLRVGRILTVRTPTNALAASTENNLTVTKCTDLQICSFFIVIHCVHILLYITLHLSFLSWFFIPIIHNSLTRP